MPIFHEKPASNLVDRRVKRLYLLGLSTRQVARELGISKTRAGEIVKRLGISRTRPEAAKPGVWTKPESTHWRTVRDRARKIWKTTNGPIPKGFHIHHKDGDCTNNSLGNLELKHGSLHISEHSRGAEYGIPRHQRKERRPYMKHYLSMYSKYGPKANWPTKED